MKNLTTAEVLERRIYLFRGRRVMLDRDLASIYGVSTGRLNEQVKRNKARFPDDFMFRLTKDEMENWMSQNAISNSTIKMGLRKPPHAFTEHGAVMLAAVLNSPIAVATSIQIVRAFNHLRELTTSQKDLITALDVLERKVTGHDRHIQAIFAAINEIMAPPTKPRKKIGFSLEPEDVE